jgi:hypothetical protein
MISCFFIATGRTAAPQTTPQQQTKAPQTSAQKGEHLFPQYMLFIQYFMF